MQFKQVGARIQVIAYLGYDKGKKRAITKTIGSLCRYTFKPTDGLIESLTDVQKTELQSYIDTARQSSKKGSRQYNIIMSDSRIDDITDCVSDENLDIDETKATLIWASIAKLQKALKKRGFKRPAVDSQVDEVPDSRQAKLPV